MYRVQRKVSCAARPDTKAADFGHVNPNSRPRDILVVRNHRIGPPGHRLVCVPVGENCVAGPNGSNVLTAVRVVQEHTTVIAISVDAVVVAGIVGVGDVDG